MAVTPTNLIPPQQLPAFAVALYTSTNIRTRIDKLTVTNPTLTPETATIYLVPAGQIAGNQNTITSARSVAPGETWNCPDVVGQILLAGGVIQAFASAPAALTIMASGVQLS